MSLASLIASTGALRKGEFTLASGQTSDLYVDAKLATCHPHVLSTLAEHATVFVPDHDAVAGTVLGGVPFAVMLSHETGRPTLLVRGKAKDHGTGSRIEGPVEQGQHVLVAEDVVTSGGSLLAAVEALREAGCVVDHAVVIVDREQGARELLKENGVALHALVTVSELSELPEVTS